MRLEIEVEDFSDQMRRQVVGNCVVCDGTGVIAAGYCVCAQSVARDVAAFEACVPKDFWHSTPDDVKHNVEIFRDVVQSYCGKLRMAARHGYGLILTGDNGVGKTMFLSHILMRAINAGFTAYYTSMPELDHHVKRGFNDREAAKRLDQMLTVDFLAIDELGKERFKGGDNFMRLQLERILKQRFDNSAPVLIATNMSVKDFEEEYGKTFISVLNGKYRQVAMMPGDFRSQVRAKMNKRMGWN